MNLLTWLTLDALQAGGLLALAAAFGADGLHRRDRMTGWLGAACLLVALRHGACILDAAQALPMTLADRLQSVLGCFGFVAMFRALTLVLPAFYPRRTLLWMSLAILPNLYRCAFLPLEGPLSRLLLGITLAAFLAGCALTVRALFLARRAGDPFGRRLLGGLLLTLVPVVAEIVVRMTSDSELRISGVGIMLMAISLGASWIWVLTHDLHQRLARLEAEAAAWRGLLPGSTWHTEEESPLMEDLFGADWTARLQDRMGARDGSAYWVHRTQLGNGEALGWLEVRRENDPRSFLRGWTVALGMDEGEESGRVRGWLRSWGAHVEAWGTVPPREGPYPSLLLWMREPSILAVWRENDLARRRCRWVQVGGPRIEGPHVRLERPLEEEALQSALQRLVALHR